ncbi:MAG: glycerophosphodiester phosphodiesterase [Chloroflexi bacterium]|nr:glycerophosphodiester phosphodiesterase [Chloroflexota bacterium]
MPITNKKPLIYAHRGARDVAPENTLAAFKAAVSAQADGVECDVSRCATGEIVILHDDRLDRTTNGVGLLSQIAFQALRQLDAGAWFAPEFTGERLPTLEELLNLAGNSLRLNIEIKGMSEQDDGLEVEIAGLLRQHGQQDSTIISSFNPFALRRMHTADPEIGCALLYTQDSPIYPLLPAVIDKLTLKALHPEFSLVDEAYVTRAHKRGYLVNVWTVNEQDDMLRMINLGVDGIITDHPALLRKLLVARR